MKVSMMKNEARGLAELQVQIDGARGQLQRAEAQLTAASAASPAVAEAVAPALADVVAVGKRMALLEQTVSDQIDATATTMPCARCRTDMLTTARSCARCSQPVARA
jgi:hypothetical protein